MSLERLLGIAVLIALAAWSVRRGLNNEFARDLLWRQYPQDQRDSPYRRFWGSSGSASQK